MPKNTSKNKGDKIDGLSLYVGLNRVIKVIQSRDTTGQPLDYMSALIQKFKLRSFAWRKIPQVKNRFLDKKSNITKTNKVISVLLNLFLVDRPVKPYYAYLLVEPVS